MNAHSAFEVAATHIKSLRAIAPREDIIRSHVVYPNTVLVWINASCLL